MKQNTAEDGMACIIFNHLHWKDKQRYFAGSAL